MTLSDVCCVHMDVDGAAHEQAERPEIVDAVRVIGVGMTQKDGVEPLHVGVKQLLAQIGRGVDENRCRALRPEALDEHRAAAAAVLRIGRIARAPPFRNARHPAGRAAPQDGQSQRQCEDPMACGSLAAACLPTASGSRPKIACVLARVASANASRVNPARLGDHACRGDHERRLVAAAAMGVGAR